MKKSSILHGRVIVMFSRTSVHDSEPHRIRIMSWNIDGLDPKNLESRTKGVCETITKYV